MVNKVRGQISVWVVLGVILVATVILFFFLFNDSSIIKSDEGEAVLDVKAFLEVCTEQSVNEAVDLMLPHGGFVNPMNTVVFNNTEIEYLCLNRGFYSPCIHQHPMLLEEIRREIESYIEPIVSDCFENMKSEFESRGGRVNYEKSDFDIDVGLAEDGVVIEIERPTVLERKGEVRRFDNILVDVRSPVYNLAVIALDIANQEANYCYFEFVGYNILHPRYQVKKYSLSQPTDVYTIDDLDSGKEMNIAIRGCVLPPAI